MSEAGRSPSWEGYCPRGGEALPCRCYQGPSFAEMTRPELEAAAERWRQRAIAAEAETARVQSQTQPAASQARKWGRAGLAGQNTVLAKPRSRAPPADKQRLWRSLPACRAAEEWF